MILRLTLVLSALISTSHKISVAQGWADIYGGTSIGSNYTLYSDDFDNMLYVGGDFDTCGPNYYPSKGLAIWDGSEWIDLAGQYGDDWTHCITRYNGKIYHGCQSGAVFEGMQSEDSRIAAFDNSVFALAVYKGELYMGGVFKKTKPTDSVHIYFSGIAKYDGTQLIDVGGGVRSSTDSGGVYSLFVYNNRLYAGGVFDTAGNAPCHNIARWNGTEWQPLDEGIGHSGAVAVVRTLTSYKGDLFAGGLFTSAGGIPVKNVARWDGSEWSTIGSTLNGEVYDLQVYKDYLYAGGAFEFSSPRNHIARWNGNYWSVPGGGTTFGSIIRCLTVWHGKLIAGGKFSEIEDSIQVSNLASYEAPPDHEYLPVDEDDFIITPAVISGPSVIHLKGNMPFKKIELINKQGRVCVTREFSDETLDTSIEVELADAEPGVLVLKIHTTRGTVKKKIVVL